MKISEFLNQLQYLSKDDLLSIKGIGETLAQNYGSFIKSKRYGLLVSKFIEMEQDGLQINIEKTIKNNSKIFLLSGQVICITGTFLVSRSEIKSKLEENGAKVIDSVTSSTTTLLAGEKAGSKLEKARKMGIKIAQSLEEIL
ncbi:MAG: hypothetical protein H7196_01705 [candidate division SR1 bacterium]|nr:hypothetical protein [candidate division SR1 bacterium]